jgi:hypothetical protein
MYYIRIHRKDANMIKGTDFAHTIVNYLFAKRT